MNTAYFLSFMQVFFGLIAAFIAFVVGVISWAFAGVIVANIGAIIVFALIGEE